MDEIVIRSMARWPDVPNVYGWLALDRRGNWLVKGRSGGFERIGNAAVSEFIGRNYHRDDAGRWFFQNGPQRVFVALHYMPLVYRLDGGVDRLRTHTGGVAQTLLTAWLDDAGGLLLETDIGAGMLDDRDLAEMLALMRDDSGGIPGEQAILQAIDGVTGDGLHVRFGRDKVELRAIAAADVASRFGFISDPRPPEGQPEC